MFYIRNPVDIFKIKNDDLSYSLNIVYVISYLFFVRLTFEQKITDAIGKIMRKE